MLKYLKSNIEVFFRDFFPFTLRGFFFFLFGFSLLVIGIIKINLAVLLWGSAFSLISLYTLLGSIFQRIILGWFFNRGNGKLEISIPNRGLFIGEESNVIAKLKVPHFVLPGFGYAAYIEFSFYGGRNIRLFHSVSPGESEISMSFRAGKRGMYRAKRLSLQCEDFLGLSRLRKYFDSNESIRVYPFVAGKSEFLPRIEGGGERDEYTKRRKRSDELLEVRKYFPGDDLRKLNWNVFAHTGELFVRIGEDTFQMKSNVLVVTDCTMREGAIHELAGKTIIDRLVNGVFIGRKKTPGRVRVTVDDYLDELLRLMGSVVFSFLNRGVEVSLWMFASGISGSNTGNSAGRSGNMVESEGFVYLGPDDRERLLDILSEVYWLETNREVFPLKLPTMRGVHGVIFSNPFSFVLDSLVDRMKEQGWRVSLFFKDVEEREKERGFNIKKLLFIGEEERGTGEDSETIRGIKRRIHEVFATYRGSKKINEVDLR